MDLPVITGRYQRLSERKKACSGREVMDQCQGDPGVDPGHGNRDSHPPIEKSRGVSHPGRYRRHPEQDRSKEPGTPSGKTLFYTLCGARGGGHLFHIQLALNHGGVEWAWLYITASTP